MLGATPTCPDCHGAISCVLVARRNEGFTLLKCNACGRVWPQPRMETAGDVDEAVAHRSLNRPDEFRRRRERA
jgi:uncharacterized Zn finger protein